jgi:uncharacterized protein YndB with AHSA1/START domain
VKPHVVRMTRVYDVAPERVFAAWTDPDMLRRWFVPEESFAVDGVVVDLRPGGAYRIDMTDPQGRSLVLRGVYREIQPPTKLVLTWALGDESESRLLLRFQPRGRSTEMILEHEYAAEPAADRGHGAGFGCLVRLERHLLAG